MAMARDQIYRTERPVEQFQFNEEVVAVFDDMLSRSVPGYDIAQQLVGLVAEYCLPPDSRCYDLGSSLGASTFAIANKLRGDHSEIVAVDSSAAMMDGLRTRLRGAQLPVKVSLRCEDIIDTVFDNASLVVMNYTLQFVPLARRDELISRISAGLRDGGVLVLSEKMRAESPAEDDLTRNIHHAFKRAMGYSDLEIAQKRDSLTGFLHRESFSEHHTRLIKAGFSEIYLLVRALGFGSIVAFKRRFSSFESSELLLRQSVPSSG
jgi:tRNA (cmo5U34)-methyltransferase